MRVLFIFFIFFSLFHSVNANAENEQKILRILSWSGFFEPTVISDFEKEYSVRIEIIPFYTSEMRDFIIKDKNRQKIDIIISEQFGILDYINIDILEPLQFDKMPNYKNMSLELVKNKLINNYSVNLSYGFMGIGYRNDKNITPPKSWADFISPYEELRGKINLIQDPNDALDIFLIGNGANLENYNDDDLILAAKKFKSFQDFVFSYDYNSANEESNIVNGTTWITPLYGFEAVEIINKNKNISFVYPEEGVKIWRDYISVIKGGEQTALSFDFINFVMNPKNAAKNTEHNLYASLNNEANKIINSEILNNELIYKRKDVKIISDETQNESLLNKKHYLYYRIYDSFKSE